MTQRRHASDGPDSGQELGGPKTRRKRLPRLGLRHEGVVLIPLSLLFLAALSSFNLFAYRSAIDLLIEERRSEARALALAVARRIEPDRLPTEPVLRRIALDHPQLDTVSILDEDGLPLLEIGSGSAGNVLSSLEQLPRGPTVIGPERALGGNVVGLVPLGSGRTLRVDLPSATLAAHRRSLPLLTTVVLTVNVVLVALLLLFLRHWLQPFESLLERARAATGAQGVGAPDEVDFLLQTFDRAIEALADRTSPEDDIGALQRTLSPSLESGLLLLSREGRVLALNQIGSDLLGVDGDVEGMALLEALSDLPSLTDILREAIDAGRPVQRTECRIRVDDRDVTLGLTAHPLRRSSGETSGWLVLFADLTETQRDAQRQRLAQSLGHIGQLTAGLAHELRNSLASVRGYLTLIERERLAERADADISDHDDATDDYLSEIRHEADHLQRVLEDFLAFARPGSTRLEEVDLERLVRRAVADPALGDVEVEVLTAGRSVLSSGDPQLLERALRNLVHNAVRAHQRGGSGGPVRVEIRGAQEGSPGTDARAEIRILDRGPGLTAEMQENLFVPFSSDSPDGVGLGLPLSLRIIELHDGELRIENRPEGAGVCATVELPLGGPVTDGNGGGDSLSDSRAHGPPRR